MPFNREEVNPTIDGEYPTAYMWMEILQADSILDLLVNFIKRYEETYEDKDTKERKKETVLIFPRYHQLRAVRKLRSLVREEGAGRDTAGACSGHHGSRYRHDGRRRPALRTR